jgi:tetratricopeptide (TPR) repeat protein
VSAEAQKMFRRRMQLGILAVAAVLIAGAGVLFLSFRSGAANLAGKEFSEGLISMAPGHYQEAVDHFTRTLEIQPAFPGVHLQRGMAYQNLDKLDLALADLTQAADEDPSQAPVHTAIGSLLVKRGDREKALQAFNKALSIRQDADTYYERAQLLEDLGEHQKAIGDLTKVVEIVRDAPHALRSRASIKRKIGDNEGAKADLALAEQFERRSRQGQRRQ